MPFASAKSLFHSLSRSRHRNPAPRRLAWPHLVLEPLEDRLVLSTNVIVGPLQFNFEEATQTGQKFEATSGRVLLGLTPVSQEAFLPLVQIVVHNGQHRGKVVVDRSDTTQFIVEDVDFNSVVTPAEIGALIYTTPDNDTEFPIRVADLLSDKGMLLSDQNSAMFEVSSVDFKATRLALARPTVGPNAYYTFDTVSGSAVTDDANGNTLAR